MLWLYLNCLLNVWCLLDLFVCCNFELVCLVLLICVWWFLFCFWGGVFCWSFGLFECVNSVVYFVFGLLCYVLFSCLFDSVVFVCYIVWVVVLVTVCCLCVAWVLWFASVTICVQLLVVRLRLLCLLFSLCLRCWLLCGVDEWLVFTYFVVWLWCCAGIVLWLYVWLVISTLVLQ